jgi:hypothetical protein
MPGGVLYVNATFNKNTAYVSYNDNLISISIADPNNLYSSIYNGDYTFEGVAAKNGYIYSAVGEKGILVLRDSLVTGVVGNSNIDVPNKLILYQNYPNPFNPLTQVKFYLPYSTYIKLILYNSLGQLVRVVSDGYLIRGYHTVSMNASELSSGVYYYLLKTPLGTITKKMLLVK